ncbi:hypothetical protein GCM10023222_41040 [Saccharopolyspora cebuensis]
MHAAGERAVGGLDLRRTGIAADTEQLVVVDLAHDSAHLPGLRGHDRTWIRHKIIDSGEIHRPDIGGTTTGATADRRPDAKNPLTVRPAGSPHGDRSGTAAPPFWSPPPAVPAVVGADDRTTRVRGGSRARRADPARRWSPILAAARTPGQPLGRSFPTVQR